MEEYLSEKEQLERIKQWWNEYGWYLVGGAALAALAIFGWNRYEEYRNNQAEQASMLYSELLESVQDDRDNQLELLARLREEYPASPYTQQAALLMASELIVTDPERAEAELRFAMSEAEDAELAMIARMRLARLLGYRERHDEALALLDGVEEPGPFAATIASIRGDIHMALGNAAEARDAYSQALTAPGSQSLDRNLLQMKLNALQPAVSEPSEDDA